MRKILVVDDEPVMLVLAEKILSPHYEVLTAKSGADAIKIFETKKPDLILSDLKMPENGRLRPSQNFAGKTF